MLETNKTIRANGNEYHLVFDLNVMEQIQDKYEKLECWLNKIGEKEPNIRALKFGIGAMLNEGIDIANEKSEEKQPFLTDKQIGRIITEVGAQNMLTKTKETITESVETETKNE